MAFSDACECCLKNNIDGLLTNRVIIRGSDTKPG